MKQITISQDLFTAINHLCTGIESKILITAIGLEDNHCPAPTVDYMMAATGITQKNHYFVNRRKLIDKNYLSLNPDGTMHVHTSNILYDYAPTNS